MLFKDHYQQQLNKQILECKECKLCSNKGPVLGYGGAEADVMFIADTPDPKEARTGIPFIGKAKERMMHAVTVNALNKGDYYFTYLVKHSIGDKENVDMDHVARCGKILLNEIELINPRIIVSMGFSVTKFLIKQYDLADLETKPMTELHGNGYIIPGKKFYKGRYKKRQPDRPKRYLIPTWSPCIEDHVMNDLFKTDVASVKPVRMLGPLLFDS